MATPRRPIGRPAAPACPEIPNPGEKCRLADESKIIADRIGISRTELIRQALRHELSDIKSQLELEAMAHALEVMKGDPVYIHESGELDDALNEVLPGEAEGWWRG